MGEVTIEETISESELPLILEHLASISCWLRTEIQDQVVQSPHVRVSDEWGEGGVPASSAFEVTALVRNPVSPRWGSFPVADPRIS